MSLSFLPSPNGLSRPEGDDRYLRRDSSTQMSAGLTIYFMDGGANIRIKNGKLQIKNDSTGYWHDLGCKDVAGVASTYVSDTGE